MSAIGVIIIGLQIPPLLGVESVSGGVVDQLVALPGKAAEVRADALIVGAVALGICILWPQRLRRVVPSPLAALILGTLASMAWFGDLRVIGELPSGMPEMYFPPDLAGLGVGIVEPAIIIALLGSIDSLLTALVADALTRTRHNPNRELIGQGLGNLLAGAFGALPGSGATMGTVTSIRAGASCPMAGAFGALVLLTLLLGLGGIAEPIPLAVLAVLAGILLKIGWDIIDWRFLRRVTHVRPEYSFVMAITFGLTVFVDLITAVAMGLIAAGLLTARRSQQRELDSVVSLPVVDPEFFSYGRDLEGLDPLRIPVGLVQMNGRFTVASANELVRAVSADIVDHDVVIFDFSRATTVDDSAALAIGRMIDHATDKNVACIVLGLKGEIAAVLRSLAVLRRIPAEHFAESIDEAKTLSAAILRRPADAT